MANLHFLVAGLGNITHPRTRHSIGHYMIDIIASKLGLSVTSERTGYASTTITQIGQDTVTLTLFKPRALMNISGRPVVQMLRRTAVNPSNMIVIHDSLDHKPYAISSKFGGSANGHNGVRDIITALGNDQNFHRLRLGIGRDSSNISEYVLGPLSAQEREYWSENGTGSDLVWKELTRIIQKMSTTR